MSKVEKPIFVVGVDHSGTTILYRMMARHPELAWFSQYSLRDGTLPGRTRVPLNGWINRIGRRMSGFTWRKKERYIRPEPRECFGIWRRLIPRTYEFLDESDYDEDLAERIRSAIDADLRSWRLHRMLVKAPYLTRAVLLLDRIFPDAFFLHIVRDGKAVALSNRERIAREAGVGPRDGLRRSAAYWVDTLEYIDQCADRLGHRFLTFRYEDFCEDVHGAVASAMRFCELDPEKAHIDDVPRTLVPTNERWLDDCFPQEQELLDEELGGMLPRWGYGLFSGGDLRTTLTSG